MSKHSASFNPQIFLLFVLRAKGANHPLERGECSGPGAAKTIIFFAAIS